MLKKNSNFKVKFEGWFALVFVRIINIFLKNGMFEYGDSYYNLKIGSITILKNIPPFSFCCFFLSINSIE